jgi:hypothetical protein
MNSTFKVHFDCDNDAFQDGNRDLEIARILRVIANYVENMGQTEGVVRDLNGNKIGEYYFLPGE